MNLCTNSFFATLLLVVGKSDTIALAEYCGCIECNDVWNSYATDSDGTYTCGDRIIWLQSAMGFSEVDACTKVSDEFIDGPCGPVCDPLKCTSPTPTPPETTYCGVECCTDDVWKALATDSDGTFSCGSRILWLQSNRGYEESEACAKVSLEFPDTCLCDSTSCGAPPSPIEPETTTSSTITTTNCNGCSWDNGVNCPDEWCNRSLSNCNVCTGTFFGSDSLTPSTRPSFRPVTMSSPKLPTTEPTTPTGMCGCSSCTGNIFNSLADGHTCGDRVQWVIENYGYLESEACKLVADEYPSICGSCHSEHCGSFPPAPTRPPASSPIQVDSVKVMSYNTEYTGYFDGRLDNFANHIKDVNADIVGLQECQNANSIAEKSGYTLLATSASSNGNTILYNSALLQEVSSGIFNIPRDDYSIRTISWAKFRFISSGNEFLFFNTHLPHRHNQASDPNTHSIIAKMLLDKRNELGSGPTLVTGDCNPFASSGSSNGSFEDNLAAGGLELVHMANGSTGGYAGLDKIFASESDWTWSNAQDVGTGSSDHPAIAADMNLLIN